MRTNEPHLGKESGSEGDETKREGGDSFFLNPPKPGECSGRYRIREKGVILGGGQKGCSGAEGTEDSDGRVRGRDGEARDAQEIKRGIVGGSSSGKERKGGMAGRWTGKENLSQESKPFRCFGPTWGIAKSNRRGSFWKEQQRNKQTKRD